MALKNVEHLLPIKKAQSEIDATHGEEFVLCKNGNIVFHWADFIETCEEARRKLDFSKQKKNLEALKNVIVWVRAEKKIHKTSMYELYEKFILSKSELLGGLSPFESLDMSFISSAGPFKKISVAECFNAETYKNFIQYFLLSERLPQRGFRIRLKSKILFEYGSNAELVALEQLTERGMLFSANADTFHKKFGKEKSIRMLLDSSILHDAKDKDLDELKDYFGRYPFNLLYSAEREDVMEVKMEDISLQSSFDFKKNQKIYIFVPYGKIQAENPVSVEVIQHFVVQTMGLVRNYYLKKLKSA